MNTEFLQEMLNAALDNVNAYLVLGLLAVGFIIKHFKLFEKIQNNLIPVVLLVLSFVGVFIQTGVSVNSVITSFLTAAIAIGIHQQSKNYFTETIIPAIKKVIESLFSSFIGKENE